MLWPVQLSFMLTASGRLLCGKQNAVRMFEVISATSSNRVYLHILIY